MKRIAIAAVLLVTLVGPVRAGFDEGLVAYKQGDYATALKEWRPLAGRGDADAQAKLGFIYHIGLGVQQDYAKAVKWYRKAAEQGNVNAQTSLGIMYLNGYGATQDYVQAHFWSNLAASQDNDAARKYLDVIAKLMTPADISKAQSMAREWLEKNQ